MGQPESESHIAFDCRMTTEDRAMAIARLMELQGSTKPTKEVDTCGDETNEDAEPEAEEGTEAVDDVAGANALAAECAATADGSIDTTAAFENTDDAEKPSTEELVAEEGVDAEDDLVEATPLAPEVEVIAETAIGEDTTDNETAVKLPTAESCVTEETSIDTTCGDTMPASLNPSEPATMMAEAEAEANVFEFIAEHASKIELPVPGTPIKTSSKASPDVHDTSRTPTQVAECPREDLPADVPFPTDSNDPAILAATPAKAAFVKTPYKQPGGKLSHTSLELQAIEARRAELEKERIKHEKYRLLAQQQYAHQMIERSTKPLTLPLTPELLSTKRGAARCAGHASEVACTPECERRFVTAEALVARSDKPTPAALPTARRSTTAHSPFLETAARARQVDVAADAFVDQLSAEILVQRKSRPPSPERPRKRTVPASPFLETKQRAKRSRADDKENVAPLSFEALVARPLTAAAVAVRDAKKAPTIAVMPALATMERATTQATYRKAVYTVDHDAIELGKKFHAMPVPATARQPAAPKKRPALATVQPKTPPLESLKRHALYKEAFLARQQQEREADEAKRVFRAQPMPVPPAAPATIKSKTPLTIAVPFVCPGDVFHERHLERMATLKAQMEEAARAQTQVKATPMVVAQAPPVQPSTKALTEARSPQLQLKRRMADRAAFDRKEQERRARDQEARQALAKEAAHKEKLEVLAWRKTELTFKALKRRRNAKPAADAAL
ncbi:hypothetical protein ACHHYP_02870 [Achlya hypogyna]|uniref:TPX2 C-terminal domain-containing protein n=1 Tax=Achlya hypogyna TaxID=1202772 RepID=A0A1V9ZRS9_ACHHY|nr:hypothetical protein ACHHYP_02870 [Achlya hypogyna]